MENQTTSITPQINDLKKTLFKHWKKDEYDTALAEQAWDRIVTEAVKLYTVAYLTEGRLWKEFFPNRNRQEIVQELEQNFHTELKRGQVDIEDLFNER